MTDVEIRIMLGGLIYFVVLWLGLSYITGQAKKYNDADQPFDIDWVKKGSFVMFIWPISLVLFALLQIIKPFYMLNEIFGWTDKIKSKLPKPKVKTPKKK